MNLHSDPSLISLADSKAVALPGMLGGSVAVVSGEVWVTQENDSRDHVVVAGDLFVVTRPGTVVVSGLSETAAITVSRPRAIVPPAAELPSHPVIPAAMLR